MKRGSTAATKQSSNFSQGKLTIGLDLGDRSSWHCVLGDSGDSAERKTFSNERAKEPT